MGRAYVIGAGLAGLSAATILAERGAAVTLIEAAGQAGGRCRSYFDSAIGGVIDNGNHLVLSGNHAVYDYQRRIGAKDALAGPPRAAFSFVDLKNGARWMLLEDSQNDTDIDQLPFWDEHSLDKQRFYNLACWLYGHDSEKYGSLVEDGSLPQARAERCPAEYEQMSRSWTTLLKGHLKTEPSE